MTDQGQLQRDIEETRAELGATVEALAHKADVKAHAREKVDHAKTQVRESSSAPLVAGIAVAIVTLWLIRRRRSD